MAFDPFRTKMVYGVAGPTRAKPQLGGINLPPAPVAPSKFFAAHVKKPRTNRVEWFLDMAQRCAQQGTCLRRNFGAVIVDSFGTVISTGYTGAPSHSEDCIEIGSCWRKTNNIASGSNYEKCRSVHAEMNAIIQAGKNARGATLYLTGIDAETGKVVYYLPCFLCSKMIVNAGIKSVVIRQKDSEQEWVQLQPRDIYEEQARLAFNDT